MVEAPGAPRAEVSRRGAERSGSDQFADRATVVIDLDRPAVGGLVGGVEGDAEAVIERGREVFGQVGGLGRLLAQGIRLPDRDAGPDAAAGHEGDARRRPAAGAPPPGAAAGPPPRAGGAPPAVDGGPRPADGLIFGVRPKSLRV